MRLISLMLIILIPGMSMASGLNCAKASSHVEKMICSSYQISRLDEDMAAEYKEALSKTSDSDPLIADQKSWLKNRRNLCKDNYCLKKEYQERITELKKWNEPAPKDADIFGNYMIQRDNYIYNPDKEKNEPEKTTDCLTIKKSRGNRIYFSIILVGGNGHTCSMEGEAVFTGSSYRFVSGGSDIEYPKDCNLQIFIKHGTILLKDPNGGCKGSFCGMRAGIDGLKFSRKQKSSTECKQ
jgi:uncharacterized protein